MSMQKYFFQQANPSKSNIKVTREEVILHAREIDILLKPCREPPR